MKYDEGRLRPGQKGALGVIIDRVQRGERYTSLVLPPGYGKSDVIRIAPYRLRELGAIKTALVLSPNTVLRDQVIDRHKIQQMCRRYSIPAQDFLLRCLNLNQITPIINQNDELLVSMTIQLAEQNVSVLEQWAMYSCKVKKTHPMVIIDESHTTSKENEWGKTVRALAESGALVVLLTATPFRSDGKPINGFRFSRLNEEEVIQYITKEGSQPDTILVEKWNACKYVLRLDADYEYTFEQAWRERPSPICHVIKRCFDIEMDRISEIEVESGLRLSDLSASVIRKHLIY